MRGAYDHAHGLLDAACRCVLKSFHVGLCLFFHFKFQVPYSRRLEIWNYPLGALLHTCVPRELVWISDGRNGLSSINGLFTTLFWVGVHGSFLTENDRDRHQSIIFFFLLCRTLREINQIPFTWAEITKMCRILRSALLTP